MTWGMQIRLWLREASREQVAITTVAIAAVVVLVAASVWPSSHHAKLAAGSTGTNVSAGAGPVGTGATQSTVPGNGGNTAGGTTTGGSAGTTGLTGGAGSTGAANGGGTTGGTSGAATGGTSGAGTTTGAASGPLTATDRGVSADTVKLGFLIAQIGGLDQAGFALGLRSDMSQVLDAYVDYQNKHGGMSGRRIVAVKRKTDPTSQNDQSQACTSMINDNSVFGVIDSATLIYAATQKCFTQQTGTPYVHSYALSAGFQASGNGFDITVTRNLDRIAKEWGNAAKSIGGPGNGPFIKGGETVGIFTDKCEPSNTVLNTVLVPILKADGAAKVIIGATACDPTAQQTDTPNIVTQFKTQNVTRVFPATSFVGVQVFLQQADAQLYHPKYLASDYDGMSSDLFTQKYPADQWDGTIGIANGYTGWDRAGKPRAERLTFCSDILTSHGLPGLDNTPKNAEAVADCDHFFIMVAAANRVGTALTRAGWAQQSQQLGRVDTALSPLTTYAPGKFSGADLVETIQWRGSCSCYYSISDFRQGVA